MTEASRSPAEVPAKNLREFIALATSPDWASHIDKPRIVVAFMLENVFSHGSEAARYATRMIAFYLKQQATVNEAVVAGE